MFTFEGKKRFGLLLRRHRLDQTLWPRSLSQWFEAKGGLDVYDKLTRHMLLEWLAQEMRWSELKTSTYERVYSRMERWAEAGKPSEQIALPNLPLLVAFEQTSFLTRPSTTAGDRVAITEMLTLVE
ncbi:MAG: hypothetical protein ACR2FS_17520, partial [Phormidesmis sp.]